MIRILFLVIFVFSNLTFANEVVVCKKALELGPEIFGKIHLGDDESTVMCALKNIDLKENAEISISTSFFEINHPLAKSFKSKFTVDAKYIGELEHWDNWIYQILVSKTEKASSEIESSLNSDYDFDDVVSRTILAESNVPLMNKSLIKFKDLNKDYPDGYWLGNICNSFELNGVNIAGVSFKLKADFDGHDQTSFSTVVARINAGDAIGFYSKFHNQKIYTSCNLKMLTLTTASDESSILTNMSVTPKILDAILKRSNKAGYKLKSSEDQLKAQIKDSKGEGEVVIYLGFGKGDYERLNDKYINSITYRLGKSKIDGLKIEAKKTLNAITSKDGSNLNNF